MLLSDREIRRLCVGDAITNPMIEPFSEAVSGGGVISYGLSHSGYDLRLANEIWVSKPSYGEIVDPKRMKEKGYVDKIYDRIIVPNGESIVLPAHSYILGRAHEYLRIPKHIKGRCTGKSSLARVGVLINTTPIENSWHGFLTIEIGNVSPSPIRLYPMEGIAQIEFEESYVPEIDYEQKGGIYQGQVGVTPARVRE